MKKRNAFKWAIVAAAIVAAAIAAYWHRNVADCAEPRSMTRTSDRTGFRRKTIPEKGIPEKRRHAKVDWSRVMERKARLPVAAPSAGKAPPLPSEAQKLVDAIERAYDTDDLKSALALAAKARVSEVKAVREEMVWTLGWFGRPALPELIPFLADPQEDVANDALRHFNDAIQEIEDDEERIKTVELVMMKVTDGEILEDVAMEYAGVDDRIAVESLVHVIEGATEAGRRQARETYESITGEAYTTPEAARKWVETYAR